MRDLLVCYDELDPIVLAAAVERVMAMSATEISAISRHAAAWVRRHFNPDEIIAAHEDALAVLVRSRQGTPDHALVPPQSA